jgi:hypothetical protein
VRWVRTVERSISWLAWIAVVLWVTGVSPMILDAMDDVRWKVGATAHDAAQPARGRHHRGPRPGSRALGLVGDREKAALERQRPRPVAAQDAANIIRALLIFVGLIVALSAVGIDLTALSVLGGAIGVGLGFGLQKIAANYISGFVILAERSLRIGDMVKVDTFEGRITDIRTRYTVIRSLNGREAIVPNETLITTRVENASLADPRVLVPTAVQVAYGTDVRALQPKLEAADRRRAARHRRPRAVGAARRVLGRRHGPGDQLLDPRSRERPGQRQVRRQPRRPRRARPRGHRDPVPAARRPRRRLAASEPGVRRRRRRRAGGPRPADRGSRCRLRSRSAASAGAGRARARRLRSARAASRTASPC